MGFSPSSGMNISAVFFIGLLPLCFWGQSNAQGNVIYISDAGTLNLLRPNAVVLHNIESSSTP